MPHIENHPPERGARYSRRSKSERAGNAGIDDERTHVQALITRRPFGTRLPDEAAPGNAKPQTSRARRSPPIPFHITPIALMCVLARHSASEPGGRRWMWYSLATAVAVAATIVIAVWSYDIGSASGSFHGLWQRINLAIGLGWIAAVATRYLRSLPGI